MTHRPDAPSGPTRRSFVGSAVGIAVTGCVGAPDESSQAEGTESHSHESGSHDGSSDQGPWRPAEGVPTKARVSETTVVTDLEVPWDLSFGGDDAYFTEREVGVRRVDAAALLGDQPLTADDADLVITPSDVPDHDNPQFGGFLGVATHPDYPNPPAIYLYYSAESDEPENRVVRYDVEKETLTTFVDAIPGPDAHLGGRIEFGPDDNLWITTGDNDEPESARDPGSLAGTILRITPAGDVPEDNPAIDGADPLTVTYGHRNPQGLAFAPDGGGFLCEHGPSGRDEVAAVYPGEDYGWPTVRGGPDDSEYDSYGEREEFAPPVVNTGRETTWAPSGAMFYTDDAIDAWTNRLFVCGLISESLQAITLVRDGREGPPLGKDGVRFDQPWLDGRYTATAHPLYEGDYGRLRHVEQGPDGSVFLLTSNQDGRAAGEFPTDDDDRIIRIEPE